MKKLDLWFSLAPVYAVILGCFLLAGVGGSRIITTLAEHAPVTDRKCVIIDAGHGGIDGGAVSCTGVFESAINLEIAIRLESLLHLLGIDTKMIRSTDVSVYTQGETIAAKKVSDLKNRVKTVNETDNAILISIHQNHFPDGRYSGAQVFYSQNVDSREMADMLQGELVKNLNPKSNRKCKKGEGIFLLQQITKPGVILECGFLSNHEEEAKLREKDYQQKLTAVIASVCSQYLHSDSN